MLWDNVECKLFLVFCILFSVTFAVVSFPMCLQGNGTLQQTVYLVETVLKIF